MDLETLTRAVDARFAAMQPIGWPAPRAFDESPLDEEYSRVTDPGKYRIMMLRAQAWFDALVSELGASVSEHPAAEAPQKPSTLGQCVRFTRVVGPRPNTIDLWVQVREVPNDAGPLPVIEFSASKPAAIFASYPQCGCDACNDGSEHLLSEIDEVFAALVTGSLEVDLQRKRTSVTMVDSSYVSTWDGRRRPKDEIGRFLGAPWL